VFAIEMVHYVMYPEKQLSDLLSNTVKMNQFDKFNVLGKLNTGRSCICLPCM